MTFGTLSAGAGGTGLANPTANSLLVAEGTNAFNLVAGTNGQLLIGQTGADPAFKTLTGPISITANGLTSIGAAAVTNAMLAGSIAASNLVGTDITTVGTITSGTWHAAPVSTAYGGLGGNFGTSSGVLSVSAGNVSAGTLSIANGGTGEITAAAARGSLGLDIDQMTTNGDSAYGILATDRVVATNAALTAARIWTLPAASALNAGQQLCVVDNAGGVTSTNTLTISKAGSDTIDGGMTYVLNGAYQSVCLVSDGTSKWAATSGGLNGSGTANYVARWTSGTALGKGILFDNNATVGIGTATVSASNILEVNGAAAIGYTNTAAPSNGLLVSGNVGIGTTGPLQALQVAGAIMVGTGSCGGTTAGSIQYSGGLQYCNGSSWITLGTGTGSGTVNAGTHYQMAYYAADGTAVSGDSAITTDGSNNLNLTGQAAESIDMLRETTAATAGHNLTVQAGGAYSGGTNLNGGNLILSSGIPTGTGSSTIIFHVYPGATVGTADNTAYSALTVSGSGVGGTTYATTVSSYAASGVDQNGGILTLSSGISTGTGASGINFSVYGAGSTGSNSNTATTAMTIASTGNVGVGTTSPAATLDVAGSARFAGTGSEACDAAHNGSMRFNTSSKKMEMCIYTNAPSSGASCFKVITSSLNETTSYSTSVSVSYAMVGGGGGSYYVGGHYGGGGGGGSSAIIANSGTNTYYAPGGSGGVNGSSSSAGYNGSTASGTFTLNAGGTLVAYVGGGGGAGPGGGGSGWYGGGGGGWDLTSSGTSGGGGTNGGGAAGTDSNCGTAVAGSLNAGGGSSCGLATGGSGASGGTGGANGGGGGGYGGGGGGTSETGGSSGGDGGTPSGGLGASNWTSTSTLSLPPAAGSGAAAGIYGGNAGLILLQYTSPNLSCSL
jgi:hypothetical protein